MNYDILHELINRYENDMERIYGREHDELFKWKAMCTWRKEWLKSKDSFKATPHISRKILKPKKNTRQSSRV